MKAGDAPLLGKPTADTSIRAGMYKVIAVLNISHSLLSLSKEAKHGPSDVYKVLLQSNNKNFLSYFTDGVDFGSMSTIRLRGDTGPLICRGDYEVVEASEPRDDMSLINRLMERLRKGKPGPAARNKTIL